MTRRISLKSWQFVLVIAVSALTALATAQFALAGHNFSDVPSGHTFHSDIAWMAGSGITSGCGGTRFCPDNNVTRGQMAAFMRRLAGDNRPPTVHARSANGIDGIRVVTSESVGNGGNLQIWANCPSGWTAISGGAGMTEWTGTMVDSRLIQDGWFAAFTGTSESSVYIAEAICIRASDVRHVAGTSSVSSADGIDKSE